MDRTEDHSRFTIYRKDTLVLILCLKERDPKVGSSFSCGACMPYDNTEKPEDHFGNEVKKGEFCSAVILSQGSWSAALPVSAFFFFPPLQITMVVLGEQALTGARLPGCPAARQNRPPWC